MLITGLVCPPVIRAVTNWPLLISRASYLELSSKQLANRNEPSCRLARRFPTCVEERERRLQRVLTFLLISRDPRGSHPWLLAAETANQAVQIIFKTAPCGNRCKIQSNPAKQGNGTSPEIGCCAVTALLKFITFQTCPNQTKAKQAGYNNPFGKWPFLSSQWILFQSSIPDGQRPCSNVSDPSTPYLNYPPPQLGHHQHHHNQSHNSETNPPSSDWFSLTVISFSVYGLPAYLMFVI